jgi:hypothetical protein
MAEIDKILERLAPPQALAEIAGALKNILPLVTAEDRMNFVVKLVGSAGDDKVASMVHL